MFTWYFFSKTEDNKDTLHYTVCIRTYFVVVEYLFAAAVHG